MKTMLSASNAATVSVGPEYIRRTKHENDILKRATIPPPEGLLRGGLYLVDAPTTHGDDHAARTHLLRYDDPLARR